MKGRREELTSLHWISLEITSKLQVKKLEKDTLEVQKASKIIILLRDRRLCVHEHDYMALRVIVDVNKTESKEVGQRIKESKNWIFERRNKINRPLAQLSRKKEKTQINRIRDGQRKIITNSHIFKAL